MNEIKRFESIRKDVIWKYPFFSKAILTTELVEDDSVPTMATDYYKIYYNKTFTSDLNIDHLRFVYLHEILHIMLMHPQRRKDRHPEIANIAMDYIDNNILDDMGEKILPDCYIDHKYDKWSFEQIYEDLMSNAKFIKLGNPIADDVREVGSLSDTEPTPEEKEYNNTIASVKMKEAMNIAKLQGKEPSSKVLKYQLDLMDDPQINWVEQLRNVIKNTIKYNEYNNRFNKRFKGVLIRQIKSLEMNLGIVIDTSGSITDEEFKEFNTEINAMPYKYYVVTCDAKMYDDNGYPYEDFNSVVFKGGGGTILQPGIDYFELFDVDAIIVFTDGYCDDLNSNKDLIIVTTSNENITTSGTIIKLNLKPGN